MIKTLNIRKILLISAIIVATIACLLIVYITRPQTVEFSAIMKDNSGDDAHVSGALTFERNLFSDNRVEGEVYIDGERYVVHNQGLHTFDAVGKAFFLASGDIIHYVALQNKPLFDEGGMYGILQVLPPTSEHGSQLYINVKPDQKLYDQLKSEGKAEPYEQIYTIDIAKVNVTG